jgi:large subunit ribosomal protein L24
MKIKTGDKVRVLAGKDKGKEGKVLQVFPGLNRVVIEGVNVMTRHLRGGRSDAKGQKIQFPSPIHASNVKLIGASGMAGRVGYKILEKDGAKKKVRVIRSKGKVEDVG